jgi:transketolase
MRGRVAQLLHQRAAADPRLCLISGDLGYSVLEPFAKDYPGRFINAGIAEQNMAGLAAGLALTGRKVFTYTLVNFAVTRCLEQIRNDICYHQADVCVMCVGAGLTYGTAGYTHQGIEDVAFMRSLPGMRVYTPADKLEAEACLNAILAQAGPAYLRMAKGGEPDLHGAVPASLGLLPMTPAAPLMLVAAGPVLGEALKAVTALRAQGAELGLVSLPHMGPEAEAGLKAWAGAVKRVVTVEEHAVRGGLGSYVAECLAEAMAPPQVRRWGIVPGGLDQHGDQAFLRARNGLDAASLQARLQALL